MSLREGEKGTGKVIPFNKVLNHPERFQGELGECPTCGVVSSLEWWD